MAASRIGSDNGVRNVLLSKLDRREFQRLRARMKPVDLDFKQVLYEQDSPVKDVYFVNEGIVSMVTRLDDGLVETGTIGYEGVTGVPAALSGTLSSARAICQIPGSALRMPAEVLREAQARNSQLISLILRYMNFLYAMTGQTAACNRMHTVDARMAKWLLMSHDRVGADTFPLTQEFLGQMLGVQRATVNIAGATLQRAGFIKYSRGRITVTDREGLESAACECYAHMRKQMRASMKF